MAARGSLRARELSPMLVVLVCTDYVGDVLETGRCLCFWCIAVQ